MRDVAQVSGGVVRMGSGTLYGSIRRMVDQGLIEETDERPDPALDDQRRRYYRLTGLGHRVGAAERDRLASLIDVAELRELRELRELGLDLGLVQQLSLTSWCCSPIPQRSGASTALR